MFPAPMTPILMWTTPFKSSCFSIGLPRIIRLKENAPELDYSSF
jgi:hypothetical protein